MPRIVIDFPEELQPLVDAAVIVIEQTKAFMVEARAKGSAVDYGQQERQVAEQSARIEREAHRARLTALDIDAPRVEIGGKSYRRVLRDEPGPYHTLAGSVAVKRTLYREMGTRSGKTVDTVSLRAGVIGLGWLPRTAQAMAYECQRGPSREAATATEQHGRLPYSRTSFERVTHEVGQQYESTRSRIEEVLIAELSPPDGAHSISVSLDRVSVPMEEPRKRPVGRPRKKAPKRPIERVFRMAYCGTVTVHNSDGEALLTLRYGRMPGGDADSLCEAMADDVGALLAKRKKLEVMLLCDGAPEMWNRLKAHINEAFVGKPVHELVDFWHQQEKLAAAAKVVAPEAMDALTRRWRMRLLNASGAARDILAELHASGTERVTVAGEQPVHNAITYLTNHADHFDYASARRHGLPIGSGNVEATCKSLFEVRFKRSGSRWKDPSGAHIADLRALALSDRWNRGIELTLAPLRAAVIQAPCAA